MKERDLDISMGKRGEFLLFRGLALALVAGILSAVYGLALDVAAPVADLAEHYGRRHLEGQRVLCPRQHGRLSNFAGIQFTSRLAERIDRGSGVAARSAAIGPEGRFLRTALSCYDFNR